MSKSVIGIDVGFGDTKVVSGTTDGISKLYKFPSVVGSTNKNPLVSDARMMEYNDNFYYVGDLALSLQSSKILDMTHYNNLEVFSPLIIEYILKELGGIKPDVIVCGLSIAHCSNSGHYVAAIQAHLNKLGLEKTKLKVIPQGLGGKLAIDKYGMNFPGLNQQFTGDLDYLGVDIGFNTLDVFHVIKGITTPGAVRGVEQRGLIMIVASLLAHIKDVYNKSFSTKEGKNILDRGHFTVRGQVFDVSDVISELKDEYLIGLEELLESEFGQILDKVEFMYLFGGGSYLFTEKVSDFYKIPKTEQEYYNAIGNYLYGLV